MKFSEMPYERPDLEALKAGYSDLTRRLESAASYEEAKAVFLEKEKLEKQPEHSKTRTAISIWTRNCMQYIAETTPRARYPLQPLVNSTTSA